MKPLQSMMTVDYHHANCLIVSKHGIKIEFNSYTIEQSELCKHSSLHIELASLSSLLQNRAMDSVCFLIMVHHWDAHMHSGSVGVVIFIIIIASNGTGGSVSAIILGIIRIKGRPKCAGTSHAPMRTNGSCFKCCRRSCACCCAFQSNSFIIVKLRHKTLSGRRFSGSACI